MPWISTYSIVEVFAVAFRLGRPKPLLDLNIDHATDGTDATALTPSLGTLGTLGTLPREVREMVYWELLVATGPIINAHELVQHQPSIMACRHLKVEVLDAAILSTCRTVYAEAIEMLYGQNNFHVWAAKDIDDFAHRRLPQTHGGKEGTRHSFGLKFAPCGRLTLLRSVGIYLNVPYTQGQDIDVIWMSWYNSFFATERGQRTYDKSMQIFSHMPQEPEQQEENQIDNQNLRFPSLEKLGLDFSGMALTEAWSSQIVVEPFLKKLRPRGGLTDLEIRGVKNQQNLHDFKHGFLRQGGMFVARDEHGNVIALDSASKTVSKGVREIVQKDSQGY